MFVLRGIILMRFLAAKGPPCTMDWAANADPPRCEPQFPTAPVVPSFRNLFAALRHQAQLAARDDGGGPPGSSHHGDLVVKPPINVQP